MKLTDPWFEAHFLRTDADGKGHRSVDTLDDADGIFLWCPCGYGKTEYPLDGPRPHGLIVNFANPRSAPPVPAHAGSRSRGGGLSRWTMSGTDLTDLTLSPSVDVGTPSCWHGFITAGIVT